MSNETLPGQLVNSLALHFAKYRPELLEKNNNFNIEINDVEIIKERLEKEEQEKEFYAY